MGRGALINIPRKHKLNVGSSMELELVNIADVIGIMMWSKYFMESQGYLIENDILYQDNNSTILLAKDSRMSAGKASKHIKNRFSLSLIKLHKRNSLYNTGVRHYCRSMATLNHYKVTGFICSDPY